MEQTSKAPLTIGVVIVVIILIVVAWVSFENQTPENPPVTATLPTPTPTPVKTPTEEDIMLAPDASDLSLDQDLAAIDAQLNNLDKDYSTITDGINAPTEAK